MGSATRNSVTSSLRMRIGCGSARIAAARMAKLGLRNSEGCSVSQPRSIQRLAPSTSLPVNSTSAEPITRKREHDGCGEFDGADRKHRGSRQNARSNDRKSDLLGRITEIARRHRAAGGRRACRKREHQADGNEREHGDTGRRDPPSTTSLRNRRVGRARASLGGFLAFGKIGDKRTEHIAAMFEIAELIE